MVTDDGFFNATLGAYWLAAGNNRNVCRGDKLRNTWLRRRLPDGNNLRYTRQFRVCLWGWRRSDLWNFSPLYLRAGNLPRSLWIKLHLHSGFIMLWVAVQVLNCRVLRLFMLPLMRRRTERAREAASTFPLCLHSTHAWLLKLRNPLDDFWR